MNTATLGTWRNPPLAYVVAELVISPYYNISKAIPQLQDLMRVSYPRTVETQELLVDANNTPLQSQRLWRLLSVDQTRGVQLGTGAISLHATAYSNAEDFLVRWSEVLDAISKANLNAFVERAGIRYVDLIVPTGEQQPRNYLSEGLQGVPQLDGSEIKSTMWAASFAVGDCTLTTRIAAPSPENLVLPPNFNALPLDKPSIMKLAEERLNQESPIGFIDIDCTSDVQNVFEASQLKSTYLVMQGTASKIFRSMLSDIAIKEWQ
jgi:uncharacterized protein (TIGR04255 family)